MLKTLLYTTNGRVYYSSKSQDNSNQVENGALIMNRYIDSSFYNEKTEKLIEMIYIYQSSFGWTKEQFINEGKSEREYNELIDLIKRQPRDECDLVFNYRDRYYQKLKTTDEDEFDEKFNFLSWFTRQLPKSFFITQLYKQPVYYFENGIFEELKKWLAGMSVISEYSECLGIESTGFTLDEAANELIKLINECYRFECASELRPYTLSDDNNPDEDFYKLIKFHYWNYQIIGTEFDDNVEWGYFPTER